MRSIDDVALIQLRFADGSIGTIQYLANGNEAFQEERVELFFDSNALQLENFATVKGGGAAVQRLSTRWPQTQDKGHSALAAAFVSSVMRGTASPIPGAVLLEVSRVTLDAAALARGGGGAVDYEEHR